jgi:hypothetical protein
MFASKVSKPQIKAAADSTKKMAPQRSVLAMRPFGGGAVGQAHFLQRTVGNQATQRLLSQRGCSPTREKNSVDGEQDGAPESIKVREAKSGTSWDFSKITVFAPDRASRPQASSPVVATQLPGAIQAKLVVGAADDPLEHEADRIADQVMRMPDPGLAIAAGPEQVSRKCAACEEKEASTLRTRPAWPGKAVAAVPGIVHEARGVAARPLDPAAGAFFEPRFGSDFSKERIHNDAAASESARAVAPRAYTVGNHVVFGAGQFAPTTGPGKALLARELVHTLQQGAADSWMQRRTVCPPGVSPEDGTGCYETADPDQAPSSASTPNDASAASPSQSQATSDQVATPAVDGGGGSSTPLPCDPTTQSCPGALPPADGGAQQVCSEPAPPKISPECQKARDHDFIKCYDGPEGDCPEPTAIQPCCYESYVCDCYDKDPNQHADQFNPLNPITWFQSEPKLVGVYKGWNLKQYKP